MKNSKTIVKLFVSVILIGIGITLYVTSGLGSDPFTVFVEGISIKLNISYGFASMLVSSVIIAITSLFSRKSIGFGSLFHMFFVGLIINFGMALLSYLNIKDNIILNTIFLIVGIFLLGIGTAIYIKTDQGLGAYDMVSVTVSNIFKSRLDYTRMIFDLIFTIVGYMLGGTVGIGTVLGVLLTGKIIQKTIENLNEIGEKANG